jgi:hypothetical protein
MKKQVLKTLRCSNGKSYKHIVKSEKCLACDYYVKCCRLKFKLIKGADK